MRRWSLFAASTIVLALGAVAFWLWITREPERTLEANWDAAVITVAGGGLPGFAPHDPFAARFADPFGIAAATDGTIYVADGAGAHRIVRISPAGVTTVLAGSSAGFADGRGSGARFDTPSGLALDALGNLYVADTGNDAIRRIAPDGMVSTVAAAADGLNGPVGVAVDAAGRIIVADTYNDRIVSIDPAGVVTPVAVGFDTPSGVAVDTAGNILVADTGNGAVRAIARDGSVSTIGFPDPSLQPLSVAPSADGHVYVADGRGRILAIDADGARRIVAGGARGFADGEGANARFRAPSGLALVGPGRLLATDRRNNLVRLIAARSMLEVRPPAPPLAPSFDARRFDMTPLLWPFAPLEGPFEVTGTLGEPRGVAGSERFHAGLDVYAPEGTLVHVVRDGTADDPVAASDFGSLSESVRLGPVAYVHLRVGRDARGRAFADERFVVTYDETGQATKVRVKRGARFAAGDVIGTVNRFYHAHLNVGWPGEELNPLRFGLPRFVDTVPPVIAPNGVRMLTEEGLPIDTRERRRLVADGRVRVVVDAWDQVDGNLPRRRLGLYRLGYQVLDASGVPMPGFEQALQTLRFDRHPDADAARIVYAAGSGIPAYGSRRTRFLYVVTSTLRDGAAEDGVLDLTVLPPGDYTLRIVAADIAGNEAVRNRDLLFTIPIRTSGP